MVNSLSANLQTSENAVFRQRYIEEIIRYALFHFFSEENEMLEVGYPELEQHRELHRKLVNTLSQIASKVEMGELDASEPIHFLIRWFLDHTTVQDIKFAKSLAACSNSS